MQSITKDSFTVSRALQSVFSGASIGWKVATLQGLAFSCLTLYEANQEPSDKPNLTRKYIVPFITFGTIGVFCGFSWAATLFTATSLTAAKIWAVSSQILRTQASEKRSQEQLAPLVSEKSRGNEEKILEDSTVSSQVLRTQASEKRSQEQLPPLVSEKSRGKEEEILEDSATEPLDHIQERSEPLDIRVDTKTIRGFEDDERYITLNISLPAQKEENSNSSIAELVFCVDKSGSMDGRRIKKVRKVLLRLLEKVEKEFNQGHVPEISLSIVAFDDRPSLLLPKEKITQQNIKSLKSRISSLEANGSTCIIDAIKEATCQLTKDHNPKAAANLVFLTDGEDKSFYRHRDTLSDLQKTWLSSHTNILAIGIGDAHDANILRAIITKTNSKAFLPNAVYNYIPDSNSSSSKGPSLEGAVDLIYRQATEQAIQAIELSIQDRNIEVLNDERNPSEGFLLGGLSYGQTTKKVLRFKASDSSILSKTSYRISVITPEGKQEIQGEISLSPESSDPATQKAVLIQESVSTLEWMTMIASESNGIPLNPYKDPLDDEFQTIWNANRGKPGYENFKKIIWTFIALDEKKWKPYFDGKPSLPEQSKTETHKALEARGNAELEKIEGKIREWGLEGDDDLKLLLDQIRKTNEEIANPTASSMNQATILEATSTFANTRSYI